MKKRNLMLRKLGLCLVLTGILYLFYRSVFVLAAFPLIFFLCHRYMKKEEEKRKKAALNTQFRDMLISLSTALKAGYSVENALKEAYTEMRLTFTDESEIVSELTVILNQLKMGITAEEAFFDFAKRSGVEDIASFASVFSTAKRTGGDMTSIMQKTCADISAKVDTRNEIDVIISSKRLEQNIMLLMPAGIIVYMEIASDGLLDPLYGNAAGVLIMSACLALYALAWYLGHKITDIEV